MATVVSLAAMPVWSAYSTVAVSPEVLFSTAPLTVDHIPRPSTVVLRLKGDLSEPPVGGCLTTGKWDSADVCMPLRLRTNYVFTGMPAFGRR